MDQSLHRLRLPLLFLAWLLAANATTTAVAQESRGSVNARSQADFSGLEPFWSIAETFASGQTPSQEAWTALFETPGYRTLEKRDRADRFFSRYLPLALSPERAEEREKTLTERPELRPFLQHLQTAWERRDELEALRHTLEESLDASGALRTASDWLPEGRHEAPAISFVIYQPDARGYDRVVMDLLVALELPMITEALIAHETHHVVRARIQGERRWNGLKESDLLFALDNLQAEGLADQIDKASMLEIEDWGRGVSAQAFRRMNERFREELSRMQERLAEVERILAAYAADPESAETLGRALRQTLVMGGHPVGFHMANIVIAAGGRERLIRNLADPFDFVRAYNEAAAADPSRHHVLGRAALAGLADLERSATR